ncbi:Coatomer subunit beta' [Trichinella patagoniensis]|uniref:mannosyl-oligosaccharide 1,3-1,6-alpha-mannosidase n=1 Tax=Trichinella patagoniensis TaxID=990121 RepID=A0A0V0ZW09_9BILA|nr:Coatomer subunit beta' [Trichinella patagoniensis]
MAYNGVTLKIASRRRSEMRIFRRSVASAWKFGLAIIVVVFFISSVALYNIMDSVTPSSQKLRYFGEYDLKRLETKLIKLESEANRNEEILGQIQRSLYYRLNRVRSRPPASTLSAVKKKERKQTYRKCNAGLLNTTVNVQMLSVYETLEFDNPDGGHWKQGWEITYDKNEVKERPHLQVFVVPHSHTDPGWIKTFDEYYSESTKHIFENMIEKLSQKSQMKFIYAEMSFFEKWWREVDTAKRMLTKRLLDIGQLEIVTGAWVMTDEANAHYFSMIDQMTEGHQWLLNHLDYKPKNHWSIDPFGLSATTAYFVGLSGLKTMSVQRIHYAVKKHLALNKNLEFYWRQLWKRDSSSDIFCHVFPFYSYDIPHTCGPDPAVCCQFDFHRSQVGSLPCPWGIPALPIDMENIGERAFALLDQYRKHAELYKLNVLLVPLGDDFRYTTSMEWQQQYNNYEKLFDYMNRQDWNVQFGTLEDYYRALFKRADVGGETFPTLSGDFFTYADRNEDYWSGYYTSRPLYKRMERILASFLRGAEIMFNLAVSDVRSKALEHQFPSQRLFNNLVIARRNLALFQHHDGIAGTAKTPVVMDYAKRLWSSIELSKATMATAILYFMRKASTSLLDADSIKLDFSERIMDASHTSENVVINVLDEKERSILVYNSLPYFRSEIVCINVDTYKIALYDAANNRLKIQISPVITKTSVGFIISVTTYQVCWTATMESLSIIRYRLVSGDDPLDGEMVTISQREVVHSSTFPRNVLSEEQFDIVSPVYVATFSTSTGLLKELKHTNKDNKMNLQLEFFVYKSKSQSYTAGGAYLFLPKGEAEPLNNVDDVLLLEGDMFATVYSNLKNVLHQFTVVKLEGDAQHAKLPGAESLHIRNTVDITTEIEDFEIVMRLKADIHNSDHSFYTDLNGLQMIKRKYFSKIPLQGNFYPMTTAAFIEDSAHRLTLLSAQANGVTSIKPGWIEVFLDRRTHVDDSRGVAQPMLDNVIVTSDFRLMLESLDGDAYKIGKNLPTINYLTLPAHHQSLLLIYPVFVLYTANDFVEELRSHYQALQKPFPCDFHLINMRSVESKGAFDSKAEVESFLNETLLILLRLENSCFSTQPPSIVCSLKDNDVPTAVDIFGTNVKAVKEMSLTALYQLNDTKLPDEPLYVEPMEIKTYKIEWKSAQDAAEHKSPFPLRLDVKRKLLARSDRVKCVDLHPTEPWMLCSLYNGNVHAWNYETQTLLKSFEVCDLPVRSAKFVPRKSWVLTGSDDMQVRVFNYNTLERVHQFEAHSDYLRSIAVHATQPLVLTSSDDMTIKLWDWESNWQLKQTFEGHTHYVMQVLFNPKDNNTFASASLDRTVKIWQLGSSHPNFTLEGHEKGVNCIDYYHGGDRPYLISGADDRLVKIWDYQNKTCVATLEGHVQNVSSVCFHPDLPVIITGSEDNTVRIWHGSTYRMETTLNYGLDRVWTICALKGQNVVAIGYDEGSIIVKLGREEPAVSMDANGKLLWAKHAEIQQANLKAVCNEAEYPDGARLSLSAKDMGAIEFYPRSIQHSPNGRFVVVRGESEYVIYTAMALRNKSYGAAVEFVWAKESNMYAIRDVSSSILVEIHKNFTRYKTVYAEASIDCIFGGTLLGIRCGGQLIFYDWETIHVIRRIDIKAHQVYWSEKELLAITTASEFYILQFNEAEVISQLSESETPSPDGVEEAFDVIHTGTEDISTAYWVGDCLVYTTINNRLRYCVGSETVTIAHLDRGLYILGYLPQENRLFLSDKDLNVVSYQLVLSVLEYQTAVMRHDFELADQLLQNIPKEHLTRVAKFLERQGFLKQALAVSQEPEHRFELALKVNNLNVAYDIALASEVGFLFDDDKWRQLNQVALAEGNFQLALKCMCQDKDYSGQLLLASSLGDADVMQRVANESMQSKLYNIAFMAHLLLGNRKECLEILITTGRLPEAAFFARTYLPTEISRVVGLWKAKIMDKHPKLAESLADPDGYPNLFPHYADALQSDKLYEEIFSSTALDAACFPLLSVAKPFTNCTLENMVALVKDSKYSSGKSGMTKSNENEADVQKITETLQNVNITAPLQSAQEGASAEKTCTEFSPMKAISALKAEKDGEKAPDVAQSSHRQPDLVPSVGGPDVLMHASTVEQSGGGVEDLQVPVPKSEVNLDMENLDLSSAELNQQSDNDDDDDGGVDDNDDDEFSAF